MPQSNNILEELVALGSSLATQDVPNAYTVPVGYFENLAMEVMNKIRSNQANHALVEDFVSPLLNTISRQMPYSVPAGYFEQLPENILASVQQVNEQSVSEELQQLSPLLSSIDKRTPYVVPDGYFDKIINKPAKVVSLSSRKWFRYAAAAIITGVIFLGGLMVINSQDKAGRVLVKLERDVKKMNESEKDKLIEFIDAGFNGKETVQLNGGKSNEVKELLQGISEEEIMAFNQQTEDIEDVLMTN
jgi:hypothetical protein